MMAKSTRESSR
ncbi:hypothetical protein PR048_013519 [Dryococelus australis]|uniref:Uncharacterized protein n=1 Tax=Dryococelus australis TaxID=614101 RepID=A0ABQ9HT83_9NEOP|nr:hypothetical protein PR048_013519 [Dryococelus australis]